MTARPPAVAREAMVATSQPLATRAGLRALERGGNAVDAALAAAAVLCVAEPMSTGIGGDCFALVSRGGVVEGLDAAGPAPASADPAAPVADKGPRSVTVPGAVRGWAELSARYGRLGLDGCLADAIDHGERGVAVAPVTASRWASFGGPEAFGPPPKLGSVFAMPELAATLRAIATDGPEAFYSGRVADAIVATCWLEQDDLAAFAPRWVEPLRVAYRGVTVLELPPPTQGVAALEALGLLERREPSLVEQVDCVRLALEDAFAHVRDGADVSGLLEAAFLDRRARERSRTVLEPPGGTVYLCAVDGEGLAVSFIQSLYHPFGSGLVAPGTGVCLQSRASCFQVSGRVEPGRRPYHTIIPGMLLRGTTPLGPFGVMGGFVQAQAHVQFVSALVDDGLDPQAALDRPRFRVDGEAIQLEEGHTGADALRAAGYRVAVSQPSERFGGGQAIVRVGDAWLGGSDSRKDGYAAGF